MLKNDYYDLGNYFMKICFNKEILIIISYNRELLDGFKYEAKINIKEFEEKYNNSKLLYNNIEDIYIIIKKSIKEGQYEIIKNNNSELIFNIPKITQFKLLKQNIKINDEYFNIISKEIKDIKNEFNNEIKLLKEENQYIIKEINQLKNIILNIQNNNKNVNINNNMLTLNDFNKKFQTYFEDNNITELDLGYRDLGNEISYLANIEFNQIQKLDLGSNNISDINILSKLKYNQLQILYLDNNMISNIDIFERVNFPLLEELDLSKNKIKDINVLSKVNFNKLKELYLSDNNINDINILENVKFNNLEKLNLSKNNITDIKVFNKIIFSNLKLLYLKNNNIDSNIYQTLINFLKTNIVEFNI